MQVDNIALLGSTRYIVIFPCYPSWGQRLFALEQRFFKAQKKHNSTRTLTLTLGVVCLEIARYHAYGLILMHWCISLYEKLVVHTNPMSQGPSSVGYSGCSLWEIYGDLPGRLPHDILEQASEPLLLTHRLAQHGQQLPLPLWSWSVLTSCIHSFPHSFMHACIHSSIHPFIHSFMHACMHAFMHLWSVLIIYVLMHLFMFIIICIILNNHNHRSKMLMSFVPRAFLLTDPLKHSTYQTCPNVFGMHIFDHIISRPRVSPQKVVCWLCHLGTCFRIL